MVETVFAGEKKKKKSENKNNRDGSKKATKAAEGMRM